MDESQLSERYLYFLRASRVLYEATLEPIYLSLAVELAGTARSLFYDEGNGGFFDGEKRDDLVFRLKDDYDSATPTPSSVARLEYSILAEITGSKEFRSVAEKSLRSVVLTLKESPTQLAESLKALEFMVGKPARVVIVGGSRREEFLKVSWSGLRQNLLIIGNDGPVSEFTRKLEAKEPGQTTVYYCIGQTCRLPETDPAVLAGWLKEDRGAGKEREDGSSTPAGPSPE